MATYTTAVLDEIRAGVDIVDLVGRFVNLRQAGVNWKGLCPFHAEKTPSFMVNPGKGIFHCFGCGVGGDVFRFLMLQDKVSFPEAVRALATTAGVALPGQRGGEAAASTHEELRRVMELASRVYAEALWGPGGERARRYLETRGIDPELARRFGLGFAPDGWDYLLTAMEGERIGAEALVAAGLAVPRQQGGGFYDRFRARLLFAIRDLQGRPVAFGGRAFGDEQPKYLNSPETPLYTKGHLLYATDVARATIQQKNRALLVEGYVDCLMAHQHGFTETVAVLGTAFTSAQLGLLRRYCDEVVTFFDADTAGRAAAERAETLLDSHAGDAIWEPTAGGASWAINRTGTFTAAEALRVKVALLPAGHDPDTFLRTDGPAAFAQRIALARSLLSYALDRAAGDPDPLRGPRARADAFSRVALMLAKVSDAQEAATLAREGAFKLGVDPVHLLDEARRLQSTRRRASPPPRPAPPTPAPTATTRERDLMTLLLQSLDARTTLLPLVEDADVEHEPFRAILAVLRGRPEAAAEALMSDLSHDSTRDLLAALIFHERQPEDPRRLVEQFRTHLERQQRLRRQRAVSRTIAQAQEAVGVDAPVHDAYRTLHRESSVVYQFAGGVAQSLEHGTPGSPRSSGA
jgi:DNA primase